MDAIELPFGQWLPDQAAYKNEGVTEAENVYHSPAGFVPFSVPVASDDTVTGNVMGARLFFRNDGNSLIVGGTSTTLFTLTGGTVTVTNPPYTATSVWRFARFSDIIVAVSKENATQYLDDLDTDTTWSALTGSPPKAAVVGTVGDFLVLGDCDGGTNVPNRVQWSAFNNPLDTWATDRGTLSDFRDLNPLYGAVTGIVGGRWGLVFQKRAIWRMVFVGAPKVFDFELVTDERGCVAPDSIVTIGYQTYFLDQGGLFVTNGSDVEAIGDGKVNAWLEAEADPAQRNKMQGAINWPQRAIVWAFRKPGDATYQRQITYSFVTGGFTAASQTVDWLVETNQDALTLADLAALFPSGLGTMSAYEIGTSEWKAKDRLFAAFVDTGSTSAYAPFSGDNAAAYITTGDLNLIPGRRSMVNGVAPIIERPGTGITTQVRSLSMPGGAYSVSAETSPGVDGFCPHHVDNWFHGFRAKMASGAAWDKATGLWVRADPTGKR